MSKAIFPQTYGCQMDAVLQTTGKVVAAFIGMTTISVGLVMEASAQAHVWRWDFEDGQEDQAPAGFSLTRTGEGGLGQWIIKTAPDAPSGKHILVQVDADGTDFRFPMAVAEQPVLSDVRLSVRCRPESGHVDQACGLVVRYQDENNYYLARANALEQNVRFYKVVHGQRQQLASWSGPATSGSWHSLKVKAEGNRCVISWDGQQVMEVTDQTFRGAGKVGVWTKADSVTAFDDLMAEPLDSLP